MQESNMSDMKYRTMGQQSGRRSWAEPWKIKQENLLGKWPGDKIRATMERGSFFNSPAVTCFLLTFFLFATTFPFYANGRIRMGIMAHPTGLCFNDCL